VAENPLKFLSIGRKGSILHRNLGGEDSREKEGAEDTQKGGTILILRVPSGRVGPEQFVLGGGCGYESRPPSSLSVAKILGGVERNLFMRGKKESHGGEKGVSQRTTLRGYSSGRGSRWRREVERGEVFYIFEKSLAAGNRKENVLFRATSKGIQLKKGNASLRILPTGL